MAIYQGDKLVAENITIDKSLYTLPVGSIIPYGSNTAPTGFLLCDGSEVSKEAYPDLYAVIGDSFGTATDGKFKLPDLRGKFVQGANGDLATVKEAGLPNITGQFYHDTNTKNKVSGAFSYTSGNNQNLMNDAPTNSGIVYFDASKSNAIYGNSDTVQPPAVCLSYIIKAMKISDEPNDQYATKDDIAKKVDKANGMSLIEDTEKERLATVVNYDDTEIKADISKCATKDVATTTKNGLMSKEDKDKLDGLESYSLPIATADTLGGVKVGSGLSITDGILSATAGGSLKIDTLLPWGYYSSSSSDSYVYPPTGVKLSDYFGFAISGRTSGSPGDCFGFFISSECINPVKEGTIGGYVRYLIPTASDTNIELLYFGKVISNDSGINYKVKCSGYFKIVGFRFG